MVQNAELSFPDLRQNAHNFSSFEAVKMIAPRSSTLKFGAGAALGSHSLGYHGVTAHSLEGAQVSVCGLLSRFQEWADRGGKR